MSSPTCSICCERLGENGGPTTLPCGHNFCLYCMQKVQSFRPECPLCRQSFTQNLKLSLNTDLRDLIQQSTPIEDWELVEKPEPELQLPSAPPWEIHQTELEFMEPAIWMSDSSSDSCLSCTKPFLAILRTRHHCRLCGGLFCNACSTQRRFVPARSHTMRNLQRVCDRCSEIVDPFQEILLRQNAGRERLPIHDIFDWSSTRSWVNSPYSGSMEQDIYKATNVLKTFLKWSKTHTERVVPKGLKGIMLLSELKIATGIWSLRFGTGLVLSRQGSGNWSPPSSISSTSCGPGLQLGTQLMDVVIFLPDQTSLDCFTNNIHVALNGNLNACLGIGASFQQTCTIKIRPMENEPASICAGFAFCRGAFIGTSLEATLIKSRPEVNRLFYGQSISAKQLLLDTEIRQPLAAMNLYQQLNQL
eukprot:g9246.t1